MEKNLDEIKIEDLNIDRITQKYLKRAGIYTLDKLVKCRKNTLNRMLNYNHHVDYLQDLLEDNNLSLRDETVLENETPITKEMFTAGVFNKLTGYGHEVVTVEDILLIGEKGLLAINGFGISRLNELEIGLNKMGLTLKTEVKPDENLPTNKKNLYKQLVSSGIVQTLKKIPCELFVKDSETMQEIIECVIYRLNEIKTKKLKDVKTDAEYKELEDYLNNLMNEYMSVVEEKRLEYEKPQKDEAFSSKMGIKIDELKKFHHKNPKNRYKEGYNHNHNPYYNEENEL